MEFAAEAIRGHRSAHSFATGPVMAEPAHNQKNSHGQLHARDGQPATAAGLMHYKGHGTLGIAPFISPLGLTITPALSSKYMKTPSFLLQGLRCRTTTAGITESNTQRLVKRINCLERKVPWQLAQQNSLCSQLRSSAPRQLPKPALK